MEFDLGIDDELEYNKIHNMNCMNLISLLPNNSLDAIITDFPYGIDFQSNYREKNQKLKKIANDKEPYVEWIKPAFTKLRDSGRLLCFYRYDVQDTLFSAILDAGFKIKSQIVWNKIGTSMGDLDGEFAPQHELIVYATKGRYEFLNGRPSTIYSVQKVIGTNLVHPNEKPILLNRALIRDITSKGELIADFFSGSGSLSVAAKIEGRRFIASELDENYCRIGNLRVNKSNTSTLFDGI